MCVELNSILGIAIIVLIYLPEVRLPAIGMSHENYG